MLLEGLTLMIIGMGTVYLFLTLLVVCTGLMSRLLTRYFPQQEPVPVQSQQVAAPSSTHSQNEMIAAVSAAVHYHRKLR